MDKQTMQAGAVVIALASLKKDLDDIKKKLDEKTAALSTEEAVEGFRAYLIENAEPNTRRSFDYLLREFQKDFPGQNVPGIPAILLKEFLAKRWGAGKKTVLKQSLSKLKWFFSWSSKYVQEKGMPPFLNPCDLIEVKDERPPERPEFIPLEKMQEFLGTMKNPRHWLITVILMTAGMRVSELIGDPRAGKSGLLRKDVDGRVLTIYDPKSGRDKEVAVIPAWVAERLKKHLVGPKDERIFPVSYSTVRDVITTHARWVGLNLSPHDLRKWCATFWQRAGEYAMTNFILRHSNTKVEEATLITSLGARYVAPLSPVEVMGKQDRLMTFQ